MQHSAQAMLKICKQSIYNKEVLLALKDEISYRRDRFTRVVKELIDFSIDMNEILSPNQAEQNQTEPECLTINQAYEVLLSTPDTSTQEIVRVRRKLLQQYHPDKFATFYDKYKHLAESDTKLINCAFDLIMRQRANH
jgi:DnaJ-domain-containing protein 1